MTKIIKIKLPAQTIKVDAEAWATEYGVPLKMVREDIKAYFTGVAQQQIEALGLGEKS